MKSVIITGANRGIGLETALSFAKAGYKVYATMRNPEKAADLKNKIDESSLNIVVKAMDAFGVPSFPQSVRSPPGEIGRYYHLAPAVEIINSGFVWHSDRETPETISYTGLAAVTRTYAKVIVDTNALDLKDLRTPEMPK